MSLIVAAPVLAAPQVGQRETVVDRKALTVKKTRKPAAVARSKAFDAMAQAPAIPETPASAVRASVPPPAAMVTDRAAPAVMTSPQTNAIPAVAAGENSVVPPVNPYLAGWYRPTLVSELPNLAAQQLGTSAQWAVKSVTNLPGQLAEALPSIKRVFPTGGRELWVVNAKCPAEIATGQSFLPANALREVVNGLLGTLNETQLLKFDIQLVCS
ncbi:MAG: hypothetical protein ACUVT2_08215 [Thiobacillaceae bacterium]